MVKWFTGVFLMVFALCAWAQFLPGRSRSFIHVASSSSTLNTDLAAYWRLDEASGTRADVSGNGNTLTDNNTVSSAAEGKAGSSTSADFESSNNEYLSIADNAVLSLGTDTAFTLTAWVKIESGGAVRTLVLKRNGTAQSGAEYLVSITSQTNVYFRVGNNSSFGARTHSRILATGTWYFIACWHDPVENKVSISVDNGTPESSTWTGGTFDGSGSVFVGSDNTPAAFFDGLVSHVGLWKRVLTADERTSLYNSGNGLDYPF